MNGSNISSSNSSLVVPMVLWGNSPPTHCISVVYILRDQKTLVTGAHDGQIILWEVADDHYQDIIPRHLLIGHTSPVKCIAKASGGNTESHHIVSSSENGEMFTWDSIDGRCLESKKYPNKIHTSLQVI